MQRSDFAHLGPAPDLLRRFVPTPFKAIYRIAEVPVLVQSNDIALLPAFPLEANFVAPGETLFEWKLVRDADTHEPLEPQVILNCGVLTVLHMGPAFLLALDQERRELLGFIGAGIDGKTYQKFLLPFMQRMTGKAFAVRQGACVALETAGSLYD